MIYNRTFETIPLLIVAALWYLIMVSILSVAAVFHRTALFERLAASGTIVRLALQP
jgi:ABC-type amino acid transport system permease subunit